MTNGVDNSLTNSPADGTMKIAYLNDQLFPSTETDTEQLMCMVSALGRLGAEVELVIPKRILSESTTPAQLSEYYQVEPRFSIRTLHSAFPSTRAIEKLSHPAACLAARALTGFDLVYTRNLPTAALVLALSRRPVLYETFRPWPQQQKALIPLLKRIGEHPRFLGSVFHSAYAARSFESIGWEPGRILVAHNGYDPNRMQPRLSHAQARIVLGLPESRPIVAYTGHVSMAKGLGLLLEMARQLPKVDFVVVGSREPGAFEHEVESVPNVRVFPWKNFKGVVPFLYAADVLLIPPTAGPMDRIGNTVLPIKTFLYMAAGRPIFGPATPDLQEVLVDGVNAVLVPPDRIEIAIERLGRLVADPERRAALGGEARRQVEADNTWERRAEKVLQYINERRRHMQ